MDSYHRQRFAQHAARNDIIIKSSEPSQEIQIPKECSKCSRPPTYECNFFGKGTFVCQTHMWDFRHQYQEVEEYMWFIKPLD